MSYSTENTKNSNCSSSKDWFYTDRNAPMPISETQEFLSSGLNNVPHNSTLRKLVTFQSYACREYNKAKSKGATLNTKCSGTNFVTTYKRDYAAGSTVKKCDIKTEPDNPIFHGIPKNPFIMLPSAATKFMDDPLFDVSEARKKIDFFRQLRNVSYLD